MIAFNNICDYNVNPVLILLNKDGSGAKRDKQSDANSIEKLVEKLFFIYSYTK